MPLAFEYVLWLALGCALLWALFKFRWLRFLIGGCTFLGAIKVFTDSLMHGPSLSLSDGMILLGMVVVGFAFIVWGNRDS